jgi:hypothetical protein
VLLVKYYEMKGNETGGTWVRMLKMFNLKGINHIEILGVGLRITKKRLNFAHDRKQFPAFVNTGMNCRIL